MKAFRLGRKRDDDEGDHAFWLITYSDMTTLLLTFFLLMFSFTVMDEQQQDELLKQLSEVDTARVDKQQQKESLEAVARQIAEQFREEEAFVDASEAEVTVGLSSEVTFRSGDATLTPAALEPLSKVAAILGRLENDVRVEGHTDDVPIATARFPSNWHLSAARAQAVLRFLAERGVAPMRLQVVGYGSVRPRAPNDTPEGRAANRRIELKLVRN